MLLYIAVVAPPSHTTHDGHTEGHCATQQHNGKISNYPNYYDTASPELFSELQLSPFLDH